MPGIDRRGVLRLAGAAGVAGLASACGATHHPHVPGAEEGDVQHDSQVRIGLLVPGTGGYKPIGDEILNGFHRYLQTSGNRLGGHSVVEAREDEGDSPETARAGLDRLLDQDLHAMVGLAGSAAILEVSPTVAEAHLPLLGAHASPSDLRGNPYVWRTSYVNSEPGLALGRHLAGAGDGPVAVVAQENPTGTDAVAGLQEAFALAGAEDRLAEPILTPDESQPGSSAFTEALGRVRDLDPEAVCAFYTGVAAVAFVRQYQAAGLDPARLTGPADLTEGEALAALGETALGVRTSANYGVGLRSPANRSFAVAYRAEFGPPTTYAVAAYDAAAALDAAIRLTGGSPTPREINLRLGEIGQVDSPRGRWQFNQGRTPTQKWYLREVAPDGPVLSNVVLRELGILG